MTPRSQLRPLYLNSQGVRVGKSGAVLQIREEKAVLQEVRMGEICQVSLMGNVQISTQAIQALCEAEVPICYFSMGGGSTASLWAYFGDTSFVRLQSELSPNVGDSISAVGACFGRGDWRVPGIYDALIALRAAVVERKGGGRSQGSKSVEGGELRDDG